jgi:hypothetical protein
MDPNAEAVIEERRPALRIAVDLPVQYASAGTSLYVEARLRDISTSGLCIQTCGALRVGLLLDVAIGFQEKRPSSLFHVQARVVRLARQAAPTFEYALKIIHDNTSLGVLRREVLRLSLARQKSRK